MIQRYSITNLPQDGYGHVIDPLATSIMTKYSEGSYVLYADHQAALAEKEKVEILHYNEVGDCVKSEMAEKNGFYTLYIEEKEVCRQLKEQIASLMEALKWVLPMAKAYAAEHPVGRNQEIVNEAQAALKEGEKP